MVNKRVGRPKKNLEEISLQFHIRFRDAEHRVLVEKAFKKSKLGSLQAWMTLATIAEAERQLGELK